MKCPKCGTANAAKKWVCARCEYVLDASFLGDDILNERTLDDSELPPSKLSKSQKSVVSADDFGGDALILGRLGHDDSNGESIVSGRTSAFLPVQSSDVFEEAPATVFVTGQLTSLLSRLPVLRHAADAHERQEVLSAFERTVFSLIDGYRNTDELQRISGLSRNDVRVTVAMLLDKALVEAPADEPPFLDPLLEPGLEQDRADEVFDDTTRALPELPPLFERGPTPANAVAQQVPAFLDDHTLELDDLPPLAEPSMPGNNPAPPFSRYDDLEMQPLPAPAAEPIPTTAPARPNAMLADLPALPVDGPPIRAAMSFQELMVARKPAVPARPAARGLPAAPLPAAPAAAPPAQGPGAPAATAPPAAPSPAAPSPAAPSPAASSSGEAKKRAAGYYELCMKDMHAGRFARAWGYAKMAADADPHEEKYQTLVRDWHKLSGGADPAQQGPTTPQEIMAAAQQAETAGDIPRAVELIEKLCAMAPASAVAHNKLAVVLATRAKRFRAAYDAAFKAVELDPGNMAYQSNMMKILARLESDDRNGAPSGDKGILGRILKR